MSFFDYSAMNKFNVILIIDLSNCRIIELPNYRIFDLPN